jgi:hypothetical protein
MAINPVVFAREVNEQFLRYQLTAFPLSDERLATQADALLRGADGASPLIKGPYLTLAKAFRMGLAVKDAVARGSLHPAIEGILEHPELFAHQWETHEAVRVGRHCLISTGTGSGKTEAFLVPILDECLRLRDAGTAEGLTAVIVYPMNALAVDQLARLRRMLVGTGISFGMYVGSTPADDGEIENVVRMRPGEGRADYARHLSRHQAHGRVVIAPPEERLTEREMGERPPRLLLTNYNQLEVLLTRGRDLGMFVGAPLRFLVFDEVHTYTGALGAEVACLIRRLRAFCGKGADDVVCLGTSATITDPHEGEKAGRAFAHRLFGVARERIALVHERYRETEWPESRFSSAAPEAGEELLPEALEALEAEEPAKFSDVLRRLTGQSVELAPEWSSAMHALLARSDYVRTVVETLARPRHLDAAVDEIRRQLGRPVRDQRAERAELLATLALGAAAERAGDPLLRPKVHYFVHGLEGIVATFVGEGDGVMAPRLYLSIEQATTEHPDRLPGAFFPVLSCKTCGQHYFAAWYHDFSVSDGEAQGGDAEDTGAVWERVPDEEGDRVVFTDRFLSEESEDEEEAEAAERRLESKRVRLQLCSACGSLQRAARGGCLSARCRRPGALVEVSVLTRRSETGRLLHCPACMQRGRQIGDRVIEPLKPLRAVTVADVHILG